MHSSLLRYIGFPGYHCLAHSSNVLVSDVLLAIHLAVVDDLHPRVVSFLIQVPLLLLLGLPQVRITSP